MIAISRLNTANDFENICTHFSLYVSLINPLTPRRTLLSPFTEIFQLYFKKGSSKKFPMSVAPKSR